MPADVQSIGELEDQLVPNTPEPQQPEAAAPPQPQASEPASAPALPQGLLQRAQQAGLPLDGISDAEGLAQAVLDQYIQARPYADYGRSTLSHPSNQGHQQAQPETKADEWNEETHFKGLWNIPELGKDASFLVKAGVVVQGDDGMFVAKEGYESLALPHLAQINQAQSARQEQLRTYFDSNPYKSTYDNLKPAFERMVDARVQQILEERFSERDRGSYVDQFTQENKSWLFTPDGQNLSPDGARFKQAVEDLTASGITDPRKLADYGMKLAGINTNAGQPVAPGVNPVATAGPAPAIGPQRDEQGRFLPAGTPAPVAPQETFLDKARKAATHNPSRSSPLENNPDYQVANETELENMFSSAGRAAGLYT